MFCRAARWAVIWGTLSGRLQISNYRLEFRFPATETPGKKETNSVFYFILFFQIDTQRGLILVISPNIFSRPMIFLGRLFVLLPSKQDPGKRLKSSTFILVPVLYGKRFRNGF